MNKKELNQAVKAYGEAIKADTTAATEQMLADGYTDKDVSDIIAAVENVPGAPAPEEVAQSYFAEWEVKISREVKEDGTSTPKVEKLKIKRPKVGITQEEADILNAGVADGENTYATMYYPA